MTAREIAKRIERISPGTKIEISSFVLREMPRETGIGALVDFSTLDWIMENITGSCWEFKYSVNPQNGNIVFERLPAPLTDGSMTYVSPDYRAKHGFEQCADGLFRKRVTK